MQPLTPHRPSARWQPAGQLQRGRVPVGLAGWLLDSASLTLRLQRLCPGRFRVRVLSQQWGLAAPDEAQRLGMRGRGLAVIRQVQLLCDDRPWVYARTVIPATSLRGRLRRLAHLGSRPLGGMLFSDPGMHRGAVELACIGKHEHLYTSATRTLRKRPKNVWGRRAVFRLSSHPLLVSEVFLPDFPVANPPQPAWLEVQINV